MWVEPHGNWGDGNLHLVELSTNYEGLDNIVAFWDPEDKPAPLQPFRFGYTLYWTMGETDFKLPKTRWCPRASGWIRSCRTAGSS